ncbi:MAG: hypothetical protein BHV69_09255 [Bacteroidales bacterium 52_46]|nr:MAG: hypothetical protein BHV69_09255 [Bacteroidales bacterium 52_46]
MKFRHIVFTVIALLGALSAAVAADRYALVNISTAYVRSRPSHSGELVTQQLMGFPVKILDSEGEWNKVETIDGYEGYIIDNTLVTLTPEDYSQWKSLLRVVVTAHKELSVTDANGAQVSDVVPGAILGYDGICPSDSSMAVVVLPDGRKGLLDAGALTDITDWSRQPLSVDDAIAYGMDNLGAPYLWGGMSPKGMDCSGLTWTAYWLNGRLLQRDASKQALMGDKITDWKQLRAGDLAFFGNPNTGRITHVALLRDSKGNFVHSSAGRVRLNSLDPSAPDCISAKFLWGISPDGFRPLNEDCKSLWLFNK